MCALRAKRERNGILYEKLYKVVENNLKQEKSKEIEAKAELKKQISKYNAKLEKER